MKSRLLVFAFVALAFSCSPKVVVQPSAPATPETPKPEVAEAKAATPESIAQGKTLYDNNCGKCHKLFEPTSQSAEDWEPILKRMQRKARLGDGDMVFIHDYIFSQLK